RFLQVPFATASGHPDLDAATAHVGEPVLVESDVVRFSGNEHRLRHASDRRLIVKALEDAFDEFMTIEIFDFVDDKALTTHDPPPPNVEHLNRGLQLVIGDTEHVEIITRISDHVLAFDDSIHRRQAIANPRGTFELQVRGRVAHLLVQALQNIGCVAVEEADEGSDVLVIIGLLDRPDTWTGAFLDVIEQAGPTQTFMSSELRVRAG